MKGFMEYNEIISNILLQNGFEMPFTMNEYRDESVLKGKGFEISANDVRVDIVQTFDGHNLYDVAKDLSTKFKLPVYLNGTLQFGFKK